MKTILHVDMNNFFASVECMLNPTLKDFPVAVCGSVENRHGIVLAKNEKAKAYGVKTAEPVWQAQKKCKDLLIVPPHHEEYEKYSRLAYEIYCDYTDLIEPFGIDECWLDVTGSRLLFGSGVEIGEIIRKRIREELGLTVSVGVSFNKTFAKLGSDLKKPDALTHIPFDGFHEIVDGLPVESLPGVGKKAEEILKNHGIYTIGALAKAPDDFLKNKFGINGAVLKACASGNDFSPVKSIYEDPTPKSISNGFTAPRNLVNNEDVKNMIISLCRTVGHRLIECKRKAGTVGIGIRNSNLSKKEWQQKLSIPTDSSIIIAETLFELFRKNYDWSHEVRAVTVKASELCEGGVPVSLDLFNDNERLEKKESIDHTIDSLHERFGIETVGPASLMKKPLEKENQ